TVPAASPSAWRAAIFSTSVRPISILNKDAETRLRNPEMSLRDAEMRLHGTEKQLHRAERLLR
ncbi:MAG TPA: hypothetical protein DHU55_13850, partial [Blastocatellia bacterium]|nr:hypothetical protein [Blastocatellia bacterium]